MSVIVAALKSDAQKEAEKPREKDVEKPVVKTNDNVAEKSKVEPNLSIYEKITGQPYTVKHFGIKDYGILEGEKEKVKSIEKFILNTIKRNKLEDTTESYKELIDQYLEEINAKKTETKDSKFQRLYLYIELLAKQRKLDERRREIIGIKSGY